MAASASSDGLKEKSRPAGGAVDHLLVSVTDAQAREEPARHCTV
jgi:hypothetical protein